jgi:hypothetical protein
MRKLLISLCVLPLLLFFGATTAYASVPDVYHNPLVVGNEWFGPGTYDDGVPEVQPENIYGIIVADTTDVGDVFTDFQVNGQLGPQAVVQVTFYAQGSGPGQVGQALGTITLTSADMGKKIHITRNDVYGLSFQASVNDSVGGNFWLYETWSTDTNISTTGEVLWGTPSWANSGGTSGSTGGTSPAPPDWDQIAEIFIQHWIQDMPPIPDPPSPPTIPAPIDPGPPVNPPTDFNIPTIPTPQPPAEYQPDNSNWTSGTSDAIDVPTSGDSAFDIGDPVQQMPHDPPGYQPKPGQEPDQGYTPSPSGYTDETPTTGNTPPSGGSGPTPQDPDGNILGDIPVYQGQAPGNTDTPAPGYSAPPDANGPQPGYTGDSAPTYQPGGGGTDTPVYNFPH